MKRKFTFLLSMVMIFSLLTGCSSKFGDIPKEDRQVYEEVYELYKYAEKMVDENADATTMLKDENFSELFLKYVDEIDNLNGDIKDVTVKILGVISMHEGSAEDKEFAKQQFKELKQNYSMFK